MIHLALLTVAVVSAPESTSAMDLRTLAKMNARYAPVELRADVGRLPASERRALVELIRAAEQMDALFLQQVWAGNTALLLALANDSSPLGRARLQAFLLDKGPWARLDEHRPFLPGVPAKPGGANFYPSTVTKEAVDAWLTKLAPAEREAAMGFFTTIRAGAGGELFAVPYSVEHQNPLALAAEHLRRAAALTAEPTLEAFLEARALAFQSNDYRPSDIAWMKIEGALEPTIGPYEVYEDEWFNAKAAFEAFITVRDDAETAKLARFAGELQDIENHLPVAANLRNPKLGALAPIRVVNSLFAAGDGNRGVQTAAFNLPNDEVVTRELGSKRVMLKNVQEAKFKNVLVPISKVALARGDQKDVTFEAFFTHILMHELMHGLGPNAIEVDGKPTTVRAQLRETYSAIEEAKADISGLWALQYLVDKGVLPRELERTMYTTFLASAFRSIRFGINEAHGKGIALQLNHFLDAGAVRVAKDGTFGVDPAKIKEATVELTAAIMTLQGRGDRRAAQALLERLAVVRPEVQRVLDRLRSVPVDIAPRFVTAERLLQEAGG